MHQKRAILIPRFLKRISKVLPSKESETKIIQKRLRYEPYLAEQRVEAYEFYWLDPKGEYRALGVLPERRRDSARVTQESIMRYARTIFSEDSYPQNIFFIRMTKDEETGEISRPVPFTIPRKDI